MIAKVKSEPLAIFFPSLDLQSVYIRVYADGSYNSLPNGESQGGQIIFLADKRGNCCPMWSSSTKLRRVARSALAAETLSMCDGCYMALYLSDLLLSSFKTRDAKSSSPKIICVTDSQSLFEAVGSTNLISDKRLRVEISYLCQMVNKSQIAFQWVEGAFQISDPLTNRGAKK